MLKCSSLRLKFQIFLNLHLVIIIGFLKVHILYKNSLREGKIQGKTVWFLGNTNSCRWLGQSGCKTVMMFLKIIEYVFYPIHLLFSLSCDYMTLAKLVYSNVINSKYGYHLLITYYVSGSLPAIYTLLSLIKPKKRYYYNPSEMITLKLMENKWLHQG